MAKAGDGERRSEKRRAIKRLGKRVTQEEFQEFTERAQEAGYSDGSEFLSAFICGPSELDRHVRKEAIRCVGQLGMIGSNVNQIAHKLNSKKAVDLNPADIEMMKELKLIVGNAVLEILDALK